MTLAELEFGQEENVQTKNEFDADHQAPPSVQLGFILKSTKNCSREFKIENFPCKVGGRPLWLHPNSVLQPDSTKCEKCNGQMVLLMQLYTAEDFPEDAYHRYLYLWICPKGSCHKQPQSEGKR